MDPLTHALAAFSLQRAAFPRISRAATIAVVLAGMVADADLLSSYFGPSAYLAFDRTYFHSLPATLVFALLATLPFFFKPNSPESPIPPATIFAAALATALLHLALDACQTSGIQLLWPFSPSRFALDWLPSLDLWLLAILLAGILLPLLSSLVTEEIGARRKGPRGRLGASFALIALILYLAARLGLHGDAIAALESRTYRGELPHRVAAFAESSSPFRWHGIVETERALHDLEVSVGPGADFDPASASTTYKPEPSPALDAANPAPASASKPSSIPTPPAKSSPKLWPGSPLPAPSPGASKFPPPGSPLAAPTILKFLKKTLDKILKSAMLSLVKYCAL